MQQVYTKDLLKTTLGTQDATTEQEIEMQNSEEAIVHTEQEMRSILEVNKQLDQVATHNQDATETNARAQLIFIDFDLLLNFLFLFIRFLIQSLIIANI